MKTPLTTSEVVVVASVGRMWRVARIKKMVVGLTLAAWSNLRSAPAATSYAAW